MMQPIGVNGRFLDKINNCSDFMDTSDVLGRELTGLSVDAR
jgi:hypothetical protein